MMRRDIGMEGVSTSELFGGRKRAQGRVPRTGTILTVARMEGAGGGRWAGGGAHGTLTPAEFRSGVSGPSGGIWPNALSEVWVRILNAGVALDALDW